jgi:hypothetical protein
MLIVCLTELFGWHIIMNGGHNNSWIYNLLVLAEISMISIMFHLLLGHFREIKPLILIGGFILVSIYIYDLSSHGWDKRTYLTNIGLNVIPVSYCLLYFYEILKADEAIQLSRSAAFWWVFGTFCYYFGITTLNVFFLILADPKSDPQDPLWQVFKTIHKLLNVVLYGSWSFAFYCRRWWTIMTSSN